MYDREGECFSVWCFGFVWGFLGGLFLVWFGFLFLWFVLFVLVFVFFFFCEKEWSLSHGGMNIP